MPTHPLTHLGRCLTEGFAYQGEPSPHREAGRAASRAGTCRPTAFVPFLQNHDQIGNRAFGERLSHAGAGPGAARGGRHAAARAFAAAAVHGRGIRCAHAVSVLLRFRQRAGGARSQRDGGASSRASHASPTQARRRRFRIPTRRQTFERCKLDWACLETAARIPSGWRSIASCWRYASRASCRGCVRAIASRLASAR